MNVGRRPMDFRVPGRGKRARVIGIVPGSLVTECRLLCLASETGAAVPDPGRDVAKLAVLERHMASGRMGLGFAQGLGLRHGAIASTIAHDHHNLIVAGADDSSMTTAAEAVIEMGGGLAAARGGRLLARLPLPIAGLMSDRPIAEVRRDLDALISSVRGLGSVLPDPFMTLGFLGLEVIPHLKLTDFGLVDVDRFCLVPLWDEP
jgi:adenine deaminase